jgi:hypothetical protein
LRPPVLAFERHSFERRSEDYDMTELPRNDLDSHDWAARAAEALARARTLPPGSIRSEAIRKAEQLGFAADMRKWLIPKKPKRRAESDRLTAISVSKR